MSIMLPDKSPLLANVFQGQDDPLGESSADVHLTVEQDPFNDWLSFRAGRYQSAKLMNVMRKQLMTVPSRLPGE